MKDRRKLSTRLASIAALVVALPGCASLVTAGEADIAGPIERAAATDPEVLRAGAEAGDAMDQLALSVALSHGLNGARPNPAEAGQWRSRALASRGSTPITQYTAAFNGQPSRINLIYVPRYDLTPAQADRVDRCASDLERGDSRSQACGPVETYARLSGLWRNART